MLYLFIVQQGLAPTESFEIAKADIIVGAIEDLIEKAINFFVEKDEEKKVIFIVSHKDKMNLKSFPLHFTC